MGKLDKIDFVDLSNSLLIVLDTPDAKRIDGANPQDYACSIKIDHHPFVEKFAPLEYIEEDASSTSQLIIKLFRK